MSLSKILVPNNHRDSRRETLRRFTLLCRGGKLKYAKKVLLENMGDIISYSDNDGSFDSALEHEGTFDAVPHLVISQH